MSRVSYGIVRYPVNPNPDYHYPPITVFSGVPGEGSTGVRGSSYPGGRWTPGPSPRTSAASWGTCRQTSSPSTTSPAPCPSCLCHAHTHTHPHAHRHTQTNIHTNAQTRINNVMLSDVFNGRMSNLDILQLIANAWNAWNVTMLI